jgi:hypothetical protein
MDNFTIREHNIKPHADIEVDIINKKNGQMTFTLRINGGNIVDYNLVEYVDIEEKYGRLRQATPVVKPKPNIPRSS